MQKKINKVADWIVNESDDPVGEVKWLLEDRYYRAVLTHPLPYPSEPIYWHNKSVRV